MFVWVHDRKGYLDRSEFNFNLHIFDDSVLAKVDWYEGGIVSPEPIS